MGRTSAATSAVKEALDALDEVLSRPLPLPSRGWDADPTAVREAWARLNGCFHDAGDVIGNPCSGQGIESVWLRAVCVAFADVELEVENWNWEGVVRHGSRNLKWLVDLRFIGQALVSGNCAWKGSVSKVLEQNKPALTRLRELASSSDAELWQPIPLEFRPIREAEVWERRSGLRDMFMRDVGVLSLQAVNSLEVDKALWQDREFVRCVVQSIDGPEYFPLEMQRIGRVGAFVQLIELLQPAIAGADEDSHESTIRGGAEDSEKAELAEQSKPNGPYPKPATYARDQWIYKNIQSHTCRSLSLALSKRAKKEKWIIIKSRNGLRNAANRYAKHHGLPARGYSTTPVTG